MDKQYFEYLSFSPRAQRDYFEFIVALADLSLKADPELVTPETKEKARRCKKDALERLAEMDKLYPRERGALYER